MHIGMEKLLTWIAGIIVTIFSAVMFFYSNFQTVNEAKKTEDKMEMRLNRIENGINTVLELVRDRK